jgi:acetyltransferase-like isoleucine patch superfamily enzyme
MPSNIKLGEGTTYSGSRVFKRFFSERQDALVSGTSCVFENAQFAIGKQGKMVVGDQCFFDNVVLLCEGQIMIGSRVMLAWGVTMSDSDFHPLDPALRLQDAIACSPLANGMDRPEVGCAPITLEDDVWIGHGATILKGVTVGRGSYIEPGSVVTKSIPPMSRVAGNPAKVIGEVPS